jgi:hypothetical protein
MDTIIQLENPSLVIFAAIVACCGGQGRTQYMKHEPPVSELCCTTLAKMVGGAL